MTTAPAGRLNLKRRLFELLLPTLVMGLQLGLFSAWRVFDGNLAEFDHGLLDLLPVFLLATTAFVGLFLVLPMLLPARIHPAAVSLLTVLALLFFVQGTFLVWNYGIFDGSELDWARHETKAWFELALWLGAAGWAVLRGGFLYRRSRYLCLILALLQCGPLAVSAWHSDREYWHKKGSYDDTPAPEIYQYSQHQNVVHVLLDAYQTDVFTELVAEENLNDDLDGFVLFHDNLGVATFTSFAIPAIFSGEVFGGHESPDTYYRRCINELGFQNRLHDTGYRINLLPRLAMDKGQHHQHFFVPNTFGGSHGYRQRQAAFLLLDMGLFRQLPHWLKQVMYNGGQWRFSRTFSTPPTLRSVQHRAFLRDYITRIDPVLAEPAYHFLHIMSPHPPYGILADGSTAPGPLLPVRENYKHEARFTLLVFMELLAQLKQLALYDDALIILQGDHGIQFPPIIGGQEIELPARRVAPVLAIKVPAETGPLRVSYAPSSIADIPATVMDILGLEHSYPGISVLELTEETQRTRGFFQHLSRDLKKPVLRQFQVTGNIFDPANWQMLDDIEIVRGSDHYRWGDKLRFGMDGNANQYTGVGWSTPSPKACWSDGQKAELHFRIEPTGQDITFTFKFHPFLVPGKLTSQRIVFFVNGNELETLTVTDPAVQSHLLTIPQTSLQTADLNLTLRLPDAAVPLELGVSGDRRMLGISIISATLQPRAK